MSERRVRPNKTPPLAPNRRFQWKFGSILAYTAARAASEALLAAALRPCLRWRDGFCGLSHRHACRCPGAIPDPHIGQREPAVRTRAGSSRRDPRVCPANARIRAGARLVCHGRRRNGRFLDGAPNTARCLCALCPARIRGARYWFRVARSRRGLVAARECRAHPSFDGTPNSSPCAVSFAGLA